MLESCALTAVVSDDALAHHPLAHTVHTVASAGTEFANECFCATTLSTFPATASPSASCNMPCAGGVGICGGSNFVSVWKVECSAWGSGFLIAIGVVVAAYVGGGTAYNTQIKGLRGKAAFPHLVLWQEIAALVADGVSYTRARASDGQQQPLSHSAAVRQWSTDDDDAAGGGGAEEALLTGGSE